MTNQLEIDSPELLNWIKRGKYVHIKKKNGKEVEIDNPKVLESENGTKIVGKDVLVQIEDIEDIHVIEKGQKKEKISKADPERKKKFETIDRRKIEPDKKTDEDFRFKGGIRLKCYGIKEEYDKCKRKEKCIDEKECRIDSRKEGRIQKSERLDRERDKERRKWRFSLNAIAEFIQGKVENFFNVVCIDLIALCMIIVIIRCVIWVVIGDIIDAVLCVPVIFILGWILNKIETVNLKDRIQEMFNKES